MSRKKYLKEQTNVNELRQRTKTMLNNKYFNVFLNYWIWDGIDAVQRDYIMRKFWSEGTVSCFDIKDVHEPAFTLYSTEKWNMYDMPEGVRLINKWNVPFMPSGLMTVNKDVVLGWCQYNHKPIRVMVDYYVDRIAQVDMVINTNLQVHKLPFVLTVSPEDADRAKDIVDRILADEVEVIMDVEDIALVKSFATTTPYIIDKLYSYKTSLENELLTMLGVDNAMDDPTKERLLVDSVNANNQIINLFREGIKQNFETFCKQINETFGFNITVKSAAVQPVVASVHEGGNKEEGGSNNDVGNK